METFGGLDTDHVAVVVKGAGRGVAGSGQRVRVAGDLGTVPLRSLTVPMYGSPSWQMLTALPEISY
ncbi:MAG: hypothetical protein ACRDOH_31850 [Streptosporangiaceae bacterium]